MQNINLQKSQSGFTLIELVIVIVILGILAAVALPKFIDLQTQARQSVVDGAAGALSSASAINYAANLVGNSSAVAVNSASSCDALTAQVTGDVFDQVSISAEADCSGASAGDELTCTLEHDDDTTLTATATIICTD